MADLLDESAPRALDTSTYDRPGAAWLTERLATAPVVMQGPMGSQLMAQPGGEDIPSALWNLAEPHEVARLHLLYRSVGAEILLTNSFQATAPALERDGISAGVAQVNDLPVRLAREAAAPCVLGSIGPCGLSWYAEDSDEYRAARRAYRDQAAALLTAGASGLVLETFTSLRDVRPALRGAADVSDRMPILVSFATTDEGELISDRAPIEAACELAERAGATAVGINCCSLASATSTARRMLRATTLPVMVRPNAGHPHRDEEGFLVWDENVDEFSSACDTWLADGVRIVGSCCGTTARTTCALADSFVRFESDAPSV